MFAQNRTLPNPGGPNPVGPNPVGPNPEGFRPPGPGVRVAGESKTGVDGLMENVEHGVTRVRGSVAINVLLLDDKPLTRECLSLSINLCDRGVHVQTAASLSDAEPLLHGDTATDVVLCNLSAREPEDADLAPMLQDMVRTLGPTPLIVLSDREDGEAVLEAFQLGVRGYISTDVGLSVALEAIRLVAAGGAFVPASFLHRLMQDQGTALDRHGGDDDAPANVGVAGADDAMNGLTARQRSVLKCMSEGKPNKIIAHELGMRESTVKVHVRSILKKLGASNRTEAVYRTMRGPD